MLLSAAFGAPVFGRALKILFSQEKLRGTRI
jgi:hypothetical protein